MSADISQATRDTCKLYSNAITSGEHQGDVIGELAALYGVQRPAIWKRLRAGGLIPDYGANDGKRIGRAAARVGRHKFIDFRTLPPAVDRDPCERCGVRHDIGCNHSRAPLGMMF